MSNKQKTQALIGLILLVAISIWTIAIGKPKLQIYMITGLLIGYALTRSRFGYAGGVKRIYMTGDSELNNALYVMFVITAFAIAGIHYMAVTNGMDIDKAMKIYANVKPLDLGVLLGGFLFGYGMILAGGCASGTLTDLGEGAGRGLIALIFYILGAPIGHYLRHLHEQSKVLTKMRYKAYLPDWFGARNEVFSYVWAVVLIAVVFLILYMISENYSKKRKLANTYIKPEHEEIEKPLVQDAKQGFFSYQTYHKFFVERWSYMTGALVISIIFIWVYAAAGKAWGVTSSFTTAGVWLLDHIGFDFAADGAFHKPYKQSLDIMHHAGTLRNITTVLGATISFLLAGRFAVDFKFKFKDSIFYALGGLFMGIGARLARGCNVGALYAAITSLSLHGFGFLITMVLGAIVVLKLHEGKVDIIPKRKL